MAEEPVQILEVRDTGEGRPVAVTAAVTAQAGSAILTALSEQLDRRRRDPIASAEDALALRRHADLLERFAPLVSSRAHAVVQLDEDELRACLLDLSDYRDRVDGEHFQPPELRRRLATVGEIIGVLWDANADVAAVHDVGLSRTTHS